MWKKKEILITSFFSFSLKVFNILLQGHSNSVYSGTKLKTLWKKETSPFSTMSPTFFKKKKSHYFNQICLLQVLSFWKSIKFCCSVNSLPDDKFYTLPNWKSLQMAISNFTKMKESYPNR